METHDFLRKKNLQRNPLTSFSGRTWPVPMRRSKPAWPCGSFGHPDLDSESGRTELFGGLEHFFIFPYVGNNAPN